MADPNIELLTGIAEALGELRDQMVFLGGCATALLITDPAAAPVRATQDVDAIVGILSLTEYLQLGEALRDKGFSQTLVGGEPPYRWTFAGMKLDLMPTDASVLGFSNRWYESALQTATPVMLGEELSIRLVAPPYFIATKLEAFRDRGRGDYLPSHDLEDVICVVDGRPELIAEVERSEHSVKSYIASAFTAFLRDADFLNALPGLVIEGSPTGRTSVVLRRLREMAQLSERP